MNSDLLENTQIVYSNNRGLLEQEFGVFLKDKISLKFLKKKKLVKNTNNVQKPQLDQNYTFMRYSRELDRYQEVDIDALCTIGGDLETNYEIFSYKNNKLDKQHISNFLAKIDTKEVKPAEESTFRIIETTEMLTDEKMEEILEDKNSEKIRLIKFYKKGCRSCNAMKPFFEDLKTTSNQIAENSDQKSVKNFKIKNCENFKNLEMYRLNTENDVRIPFFQMLMLQFGGIRVPHTPYFVLVKNGKIVPIDLIKEEFNPFNTERAVRKIIKEVENI